LQSNRKHMGVEAAPSVMKSLLPCSTSLFARNLATRARETRALMTLTTTPGRNAKGNRRRVNSAKEVYAFAAVSSLPAPARSSSSWHRALPHRPAATELLLYSLLSGETKCQLEPCKLAWCLPRVPCCLEGATEAVCSLDELI
jgi:hypothetical protein